MYESTTSRLSRKFEMGVSELLGEGVIVEDFHNFGLFAGQLQRVLCNNRSMITFQHLDRGISLLAERIVTPQQYTIAPRWYSILLQSIIVAVLIELVGGYESNWCFVVGSQVHHTLWTTPFHGELIVLQKSVKKLEGALVVILSLHRIDLFDC